jgi:sterol desaturase/sphingolipid hydroxylase (fatty acid hydroxylase superfamily)
METILAILIPATFVMMLVLERCFPGRELPRVRGWLAKGVAFFVMGGVLGAMVPALLVTAIAPYAPLHLTGLGTAGGAVAGFLAADLVGYGMHRLMHNVPALWRWTHQLHHSAERIDVAGSTIFHPIEMVVMTALTSLPMILLGITADAAALAGFIGFAAGTFPHLNVRTPQWLGWIIQRPEAHAVHHARGVHAYNYGTFMLWDIVLGTFRNPVSFSGPAGFWDGASRRLLPMLAGRDVANRHEEA